ncbi:hypothetical protein [Salinicoccus luteus]|nr:hypothetical protein [Salinicoccus luteus]
MDITMFFEIFISIETLDLSPYVNLFLAFPERYRGEKNNEGRNQGAE